MHLWNIGSLHGAISQKLPCSGLWCVVSFNAFGNCRFRPHVHRLIICDTVKALN
jgi:hypothetical protein